MGRGETTPPMKPMLHGRGGGAALSVAMMHALVSGTAGNSAVWTVPPRPKSVTDAGCGMLASCATAVALSGATTNARDGDSATTRSSGPALVFQFRWGAGAEESTATGGRGGNESPDAGGLPRSHATAIANIQAELQRRNGFI